MCQRNKKMGGHIAKLVGKWLTVIFITKLRVLHEYGKLEGHQTGKLPRILVAITLHGVYITRNIKLTQREKIRGP